MNGSIFHSAANSFTSYQMQQLVSEGRAGARSNSPELRRIAGQVVHLRGGNVSWAFDVPLSELMTASPRVPTYCGSPLIAPLAIFKVKGDLWMPKLIIQYLDDADVDRQYVHAFHAATRA